jgi:hypothetical protein
MNASTVGVVPLPMRSALRLGLHKHNSLGVATSWLVASGNHQPRGSKGCERDACDTFSGALFVLPV